ncbi:hypothetical protein AVEN_20923-1 [Araneus ventricosus]|uniref:HTH CENPB-type domain-containing protein n=1 Tax=Araneus ventricosus TaxID=182803 RepID=A0A4Y2L217_ARAVE|nr:hypothetical protein AVEN_20923-1 [Araneus ventricosus]
MDFTVFGLNSGRLLAVPFVSQTSPATLAELEDAIWRTIDGIHSDVLLSAATVEQKFQIVNRIEAGETLAKLSKEFGVSTVGDMRRDSEKIKKFYAASNGKSAKLQKTMKCTNGEELDNVLYKWFIQKRSEGVRISGMMIQQQALNFNSKLGGSKKFQASSG